MKTVTCPACRRSLSADSKHCGYCGLRLSPITPRALSSTERGLLTEPEEEFLAHADTVNQDRPRRQYRRFPLEVEVSYWSEHNFYTGATENIGSGGLFVATPDPLPVGELLEVGFTLPGIEGRFTVRCEVCWVRRAGDCAPGLSEGMGLAFQDLDPEVERYIDAFLVHREPVLYED